MIFRIFFLLFLSACSPTHIDNEVYMIHIDFCGEYSDSSLNQIMPEILFDIKNQKFVKIKLESDYSHDSIFHILFLQKMDSLKKIYPKKFEIESCFFKGGAI